MSKGVFKLLWICFPAISPVTFAARVFGWIALGLASANLVAPGAWAGQAADTEAPGTAPANSQNNPQFRLRVESNLVVVRVVVRDSQGRPIETLQKQDFRIFDNGKEQNISQFSVERPPTLTAGAPAPAPATGPEKAVSPSEPAPPRVLALYFDDLNMDLDEINSSLHAAETFLTAGVRPSDRIAIFTSSGHVQTGFTSDLKTLRDALSRVIVIPNVRGCPDISDYQAERIVDYDDPDAYELGISDAVLRCHMAPPNDSAAAGMSNQNSAGSSGGPGQQNGSPGSGGQQSSSGKGGGGKGSGGPGLPPEREALRTFVGREAEIVWMRAQGRAGQTVNGLSQIANFMAGIPGQKEIILISPGFLTVSLEEQTQRVIDRALRAQIVVSSLDPKGVALLMPETDISSNYDPKLTLLWNSFASSNDFYGSAVLSEIAQGTGGDFFRHNNDLGAGFSQLGMEPVSYILAFAPKNLDGKFHKIQVKLTQSKGTVQARSGYLAAKYEPQQPAQQAVQQTHAQTYDLRQAMASREEFTQLSIDVSTQVAPSAAETKDLTVLTRLDLASVHFRKEGDQNVNTLTFAAGVYSSDGRWITGEQKRFDLKLPDAQLASMRANGVGIHDDFQLKPGKYLIRVVVQDSGEQHFGALNREVDVQ